MPVELSEQSFYNHHELPREEEIFKVPETPHYDWQKYEAQRPLIEAAKGTSYLYEKHGLPEGVISSDGVGTKVEEYLRASEALPEKLRVYLGIMRDLYASVLDDLACKLIIPKEIGVIIDFNPEKVSQKIIDMLGKSYSIASDISQVPINGEGSEIANMGDQVKSLLLNGYGIGCDRDLNKAIDKTRIKVGDIIIGLEETCFRANGYGFIRKILQKEFGNNYHHKLKNEFMQALVHPSTIYTGLIKHIIGNNLQPPRLITDNEKCAITGAAHITGQGLAGKGGNMVKGTGYGMFIDNPFDPPPAMLQIQQWGNVPAEVFYKTWHGGTGLVFSVEEKYVDSALSLIEEYNQIDKELAKQFNEKHPECQRLPQKLYGARIGFVTEDPRIIIKNKTLDIKTGKPYLSFSIKQL